MSDSAFNPFKKLGDELQLPDDKSNEQSEGLDIEKATISEQELEERLSENSTDLLKSKGVVDALKGDTVDSVIIEKTNEIIKPNFVIDLEKVKINPTIITAQALDGMIHPEGNVAIYFLYDGRLTLRGMGLSGVLNRLLPRVVYNILGPKAKLYGDFELGGKVKLINESNILTKRMNI